MSGTLTYSFNYNSDEELMKHLIKWTEILNKTENDNEVMEEIDICNPDYFDIEPILNHKCTLVHSSSIVMDQQYKFAQLILSKVKERKEANERLFVIDNSIKSEQVNWESFNVDQVVYTNKEGFNLLNGIELHPEYKITIIIMDYNSLYLEDESAFEIALDGLIHTENVSIIAFCGNFEAVLLPKDLESAFTLRIVFNTLQPEYSKNLIGTEDGYYLQDNNFIMYDTKTNVKQLYLWNGLTTTE